MPLHQLLPDTSGLSIDQKKDLEEQIQVDMVAVHGLNPRGKDDKEHAFDTWRKPAGPNGRLWLRDDLKDFASQARIFLWEYNSRLVWGGDKSSFVDKGDGLLAALHAKRMKALINALNSKLFRPIKDSTCGLVFFGTPHYGGNRTLVNAGSVATRFACLVGAQKNLDIEQTLQSSSLFTETHQRMFKNQKLDCPIVSFWEGYGDIVPKDSATFGLPDDKEALIEIKATHNDMCRFDSVSPEDQNCPNMFERISKTSITMHWRHMLEYASAKNRLIVSRAGTYGADDDLRWFTNTTLYHAWLSPPREGVICSRLLWYRDDEDRLFVDRYMRSSTTAETDYIYLDCKLLAEFPGISLPLADVLHLDKVGLAIWCFIARALQTRAGPDFHAALVDLFEFGEEADKFSRFGAHLSLLDLGHFLTSVLNYRPSGDVVILLDHVDKLSHDDQVLLRNSIQNIIDDQRSARKAQTRVLLASTRSTETSFAFKGTATIDTDMERTECLESLFFPKMNFRRNNILTIEGGTGHWLWTHPAYQRWRGPNSSILWIFGKPGSGKSVLARNIQNRFVQEAIAQRGTDLSPLETPIICPWYYSERDSLTSHLLMLRSLLHQIVVQDVTSFTHCVRFYRKVNPFLAATGDLWDVENLESVLRRISFDQERKRPLLCILDGLDESEKQASNTQHNLPAILEFLCGLTRFSSGVKILVLSRADPIIEHKLKKYDGIAMHQENHVDVAMVIDAGIRALRDKLRADDSDETEEEDNDSLYASSLADRTLATEQITLDVLQHEEVQQGSAIFENNDEGDNSPSTSSMTPSYSQIEVEDDSMSYIRSRLASEASGVILWVKTVLARLEMRAEEPFCTESDLKLEFDGLPLDAELGRLYEDIVLKLSDTLKSDSARKLAQRALVWVKVGAWERGLRWREFLDILCLPEDIQQALRSSSDPFLRLAKDTSIGSFRRRLQRLCGNFIEFIELSKQVQPSQETTSRVAGGELQLIHETVKEFLETDPRAGFFRIPTDAREIAMREASAYISIALPHSQTRYDPIPVPKGCSMSKNVETILDYLERKPLLSFLCTSSSDLQESVPSRYREISTNTEVPPVHELDRLQIIAETYFYTARSSGALRAAMHFQLLPEIKTLAWYIGERGLILLDSPNGGVAGLLSGGNPLIREALATGNEEIATIVIGYEDDEAKKALQSWVQAYQREQEKIRQRTGQTPSSENLEGVRDAIRTMIDFWGSPPRPSELGPNVYGTNLYGDDVFSGMLYGANVAGAKIYAPEVSGEDIHTRNTCGTRRRSHQQLNAEISILRGGRNAYNPRLASLSHEDQYQALGIDYEQAGEKKMLLPLDGATATKATTKRALEDYLETSLLELRLSGPRTADKGNPRSEPEISE
ncbi:hypothetical protein MMC25_000428 [Agyrium rufum]|nr:hypothetical protein [Agyrium rufum]